MDLTILLNYVLGGTSVVSLYIAYKSRKSEIKKAEANALEALQNVYTKMVLDTERRFDEMRREIDSLREKCRHCTHTQK